jgi:hypothetical protein
MLEHFLKPQDVVNRLFELTASGGCVLATTPFIYRFHPDPFDYFRYTKNSLSAIFEEAGFQKKTAEQRGDMMLQFASALWMRGDNIDDWENRIKKRGDRNGASTVGIFCKA